MTAAAVCDHSIRSRWQFGLGVNVLVRPERGGGNQWGQQQAATKRIILT